MIEQYNYITDLVVYFPCVLIFAFSVCERVFGNMQSGVVRSVYPLLDCILCTRVLKFTIVFQDLNIGIALWLAAGGNGQVNKVIGHTAGENNQLVRYKSEARILLVGSGADEQCAGYGRHKTKFRQGRYVLCR